MRFTPDRVTGSSRYRRRFDGSTGKWLLERQCRAIRSLMRELPGRCVLEVGGGHGQMTAALVESGYRTVVQGSSREALACAADLPAAQTAALCVGDTLRLPFGDGAWEMVIALHLLSHTTEPAALIREWCRVAAGAVIVNFASRRSLNLAGPWLLPLKCRLEPGTRPFAVYAPRRIDRLFARHGFRRMAAVPLFGLPLAVHRCLRCVRLSQALEDALAAAGVTGRFGSPVVGGYVRKVPGSG